DSPSRTGEQVPQRLDDRVRRFLGQVVAYVCDVAASYQDGKLTRGLGWRRERGHAVIAAVKDDRGDLYCRLGGQALLDRLESRVAFGVSVAVAVAVDHYFYEV